MARIEFNDKLSHQMAKQMILMFAKHGNHYHNENFISDHSVAHAYKINGVDFDWLIEKSRSPEFKIPLFENMLSSTITMEGCSIQTFDACGKPEIPIEGDGEYTKYPYWALMEKSYQLRQSSVEKPSYIDLHSAITIGISAIEHFMNSQAISWDTIHTEMPLLDSKENKVSIEEKIKKWTPIITNGKNLEIGGVNWNRFLELKSMRDEIVHPKGAYGHMQISEMPYYINILRDGIADIIIQLHLIFKIKIPAIIIRYKYTPDVKLMK